MNKKRFAVLYFIIVTPLMLCLLFLAMEVLISIGVYLRYQRFDFDGGLLKIAFKLVPLFCLLGAVFWYLECRRLKVRLPFINDNRETRWVEAANSIAEDIHAKVHCPECQQAFLEINISLNEHKQERRHMSCPNCAVEHIIGML